MEPTFSLSSAFPSAASSPATWTRAVEALAEIDQVDTTILHGIFSSVPDLTSRISDSARESIALKYLEEWLDSGSGWRGPPLPRLDKGRIDYSRSAMEVLLDLLGKAANSGGLKEKGAACDLRQYVLKKSAALSKNQLKNKVHGGFSKTASLKEKSGLPSTGLAEFDFRQNGDNQNAENCDMQNGEHGEKQYGENGEEQNGKHGEKQCGENGDKQKGKHGEKQNGENGDKQNGEKWKSIFTVDQPSLLKKISAAHSTDDDNAILQEDPSGSGQQSPQQDGDEVRLPKQISATPSADNGKQILHQNSSGSDHQTCQLNISEGGKQNGDKAQDGPSIPKTVGDNDAFHVLSFENRLKEIFADEKNESSHIPLDQDSMEDDIIENVLCYRCGKGGILLNCRSSNCSVTVHESCNGSSITFDQIGRFVCPLCLYRKAAVSYWSAKRRYLHAKKMRSQAKKALADFVGKPSKRQFQEESSHPRSSRKKGQAILGVSLSCHHKGKMQQRTKNIKENRKNNRTVMSHHRSNLSGLAETSQNIKMHKVSCNLGEISNTSEESPKMTDCVMGKGSLPAVQQERESNTTPDNGNVACKETDTSRTKVTSDGLQVTPFTEVEREVVKGCPSVALVKQDILAEAPGLTDNMMVEGCEFIGAAEQQVPLADRATDNGNLAWEKADASRTEMAQNLHQAKFRSKTILVQAHQMMEHQRQPDFAIEQYAYIPSEKDAMRSLTNESYAKKRKLNVPIDTAVDDAQPLNASLRQHPAETNATTYNGNLTCEEGEASTIREMRVLKSESILLGIDIEKQKYLEQTDHVIDSHHSPDQEAVTAPAGTVMMVRENVATSPNRHSHLTNKDKKGGQPSVRDDGKYESKSNHWSFNKKPKHYWTPEEEEALREAMQNVSPNEKGTVPWTKVSQMINHKFREARHPREIKDKWRNIRLKDSRQQGKG